MLRGENRQLKKRLKQLEKQLRIQEDKEDDVQLELEGYAVYQPEAQIKKVDCPKCFLPGFEMVIDLDIKQIFQCNSCDHKKVVSKK